MAPVMSRITLPTRADLQTYVQTARKYVSSPLYLSLFFAINGCVFVAQLVAFAAKAYSAPEAVTAPAVAIELPMTRADETLVADATASLPSELQDLVKVYAAETAEDTLSCFFNVLSSASNETVVPSLRSCLAPEYVPRPESKLLETVLILGVLCATLYCSAKLLDRQFPNKRPMVEAVESEPETDKAEA
ncbi:uncharacterized protein V1510DRAFT_447367, partial [Dipodascopsis tothii]|uniref:uncharacterized protein n=1 Tax=Dipodascopsis tothii TaxID=44089 RepID=UPI0034CFDB8B